MYYRSEISKSKKNTSRDERNIKVSVVAGPQVALT